MRAGTGNRGFDAARCRYVDLIEAGIIDPTKVVRLALENAVSSRGVLLLTEATLTEVPEPKPEGPAAPRGRSAAATARRRLPKDQAKTTSPRRGFRPLSSRGRPTDCYRA